MTNNNSTPMVLSSNNWMFIAFAFLLLQSACKQIDKESNTSFSFNKENGGSTALNPAHHLEFEAKANRFEVKQPHQAYKPISIELKKLKVDGKALEIASSPNFDIKDNSLHQVAEDYIIEYVNDYKGLRQNFIINGEGSAEDINFELELGVISELEMSKINDFGIEFVDDNGNSMLTYKDLITFDDNNKILDSRMSFEKLEDDQYKVLIKGSGRGVSYPITIDPLMTSFSSYESTMAGNETGTSVEGKCDVDGDGFCDLIVGSPGFIKDGISNIGKVEIFLGTATGINLTVAPNFILYGDTLVKKAGTVSLGVGPRFGQSISCGMDINGDGADDFIVGAPNATYIDTVGGVSDTITSAGSAYVFYGPTLGSDTLYGNQVNLRLGSTVAGLGNLNGDAFADFALGAPGFQNNRGLVLVYRGLMGGFTASPTDSLKGIQEGELFGSALAGVRDVGGDGRADILVGAYQYINGTDTAAGRAALYRGQAGAMPVTSAWQAIGPHKNAYLGFSVAGGGNFNGVGLPDVLIGVKQYNEEFISTMTDTISGYGLGTGNGAVYVYQGTVTGLSATPITILKTDFPASGFGSAVSYAGDVDGDGLHDVIVGAPTFTKNFKDEGASFAFYGKNFQAGQDITFDWCAVGEKQEANFGSSLTNSGLCVVDTSTIYVGAVGFPNVDTLRSGAVFSYKGDRCGLIKVAEPMFTSFLPDTIFRVAGLDTCGAFVPFMYPMIGVNCPDEASLSIITAIDSGGFFPIGDNLVTFRIESEGKIVDSSFIVKVFDNQAPEIQTCPTTVSIILSGTDTEGTVTWDDPIFNDNSSCAGQTLTLVQESGPTKGSMQGIGVYPIVYKSTDESGNEAYCTFRVIVRKGGADGRDCNDQAINANLMIAKTTNPDANFEYGENLSDRMRGNPTFGVDLLISLFESVSGISLPGWVKTALGQFGNGVDLAFIKLEFLYAPTIDIRYGMFYDIEEDSPAVATMDYVGQICAFKPADTFFGCRDTIDISTSFLVDPTSSIMRVTPGGLKQTLGIFMRDFTFSWRIGIKVSGCIGIPLCLPFIGCAGCLGYEDSFEYGVDVFDPINLLPGGGIRIPIITACDEAFMPGASIATAIECSAGSSGGVSSFIAGLVTELSANQVPGDPFFYDQVNDEFVFAPNRIPLLGNKIPEMDLRFGRLTQNEMNPSSVNGTALTVSGRNYNMFSATLDIFSLLFYALPQNIQQGFCAAGIDIGTRTINFGAPSIDEMGKCSVKFYNTYLSLDVLDLNAILRAEYNASYSFDPQITIDSMNLGFPTYWERPDAMVPTSGTSQKIENVGMDENIRFVVPDGLNDPFFISNEFSAEGSFVGQDSKSQKLDFGIKMFEIVPALRFPVSLGPLVNLGPYNILTLSNTNIRNYNEPITIEGFSATVSMQPDDIPPVIFCNDTTVFVNAEGLAFLDAETAFDRLASYDLPTGGSGSLNLIDVFPDTIYCSDYPSTTGYLVIEDDNCNFDTCEFTVTVMDTMSPQIGCVDLVVALGANGMYVLNPDEIAVGATDNCSNLTITATPNTFTCADVGIPRSVTITVTDIAGNSKSCVTTVTVVDTMQADIICPFLPAYPAIRNTLPNFCVYIPNATEFRPTVIANDCNTLVTYVLSGATTGSGSDNVAGVSFNLGTTLITYTATDESGNTRTCSFSVIVEDNEAPQIVCPDDVTLSTNEDLADDYNCTTDHTWTHPTPGDNCTTIKTYTVTYTSPTGVETTEDLTARLGTGLLDETRNFELGTTSIEYLATDTMDNEVICIYEVTVIDDESPMIFCEEVIGCQNYTYAGEADIAPNDVTTFTLNVSNNILISDVNVILAGSADNIGLLGLDLVSPNGDTVNLFSNLCAPNTGFNMTLDDEALIAIGSAPCGSTNNGNSYTPESMLSDLDSTSSLGNWQLVVTSASLVSCGFVDEFTLEICGNEQTMDMATLVSILTDGDACEYAVDSTNFDPPFIDNCSNVRLSHNYAFSPTNTSLLGTILPLGQTTITWTATDTAGNTSTCTMVYDVKDQIAPEFINCPEPDVIQEAEPGTCGAFVNFALPIAFDNCDGQVAVVQTDGTGLGSGSLFPVGMTILVFQATDGSGNSSLCTVRIIVNDTQNGQFACPQDVIKSTDPGVFSAVVIGIAPTSIVDNCVNNNNISYKVEFPSGSGTIIGGGVQDASGDVFPKGISEVTYKLMSQPLLLITEVSQDIQAPVGGMDMLPYTVSTNNDYVEITNFGPAAYNISGLDIERFGNGFLDVFTVPNMTILQSGETLVVHYGNGTDDIAAHFFNLPCAVDIATSEPAGYAISFKTRTLDVATTNSYNPIGQGTSAIIDGSEWTGNTGNSSGFGGIIRKYTFDNNDGADFEISSNCYPLTIGSLNPDLEAYAPNGFTTALQSIPPQVLECSFMVTVNDLEAPTCKEIVTDNIYNGGPIAGGFDSCNESEITVPGAEDCILDSITVTLNGTFTGTDSIFVDLIAPSGKRIQLFHAPCPGGASQNANLSITLDDMASVSAGTLCGNPTWTGTYLTTGDSLQTLYGEATGGVWRLSVGGLGTSDSRVDITSWSMNITCLSNYQMADVVIDNEIGQCGSIFSWTHPYFLDNSNAGNISVSYTTLDADCKPTDGSLLGNGGQEVTEYFCVGTTTVTYTLADNDGNLELCSFNVTVLDAEDPILNLANCQNIVIQLGSTLCDRMVEFNTNLQTIGTDNCAVTDIVYSPASGTLFPIGITPVTLTIYDEAGNADSCVFTVEVLEFLPVDPQFACNQLINLSLDETCMSVITPDMILTGTEYRCLDNFCVTIVDSMGRPHDNLFTLDDLGDIFKVSVSDCIGGLNSCWGYVKIEEKLVPTIECPADLTIMCGANTKPDSTGYALLRSCEPMAEIYYEDRIQTFGVCNSIQSIITRNWFIDDKQGNIVTCAQRITVVPITLDSIVWPADIQVNQAFECSDVVANPSLIEPGNTGYPLVSGQKLLVGNSCMISIIKTDEVYPLCEGAYLIARTWKIANACVPFGPNNPRIHTQAIRVFDNTPPVIAPCPEDMTISTSAWYCFTESVELPIPENVYDVCGHVDLKAFVYGGGKIKMTGKLSEGTLKIYATDLTKGLHTILYRVTDGCGNVAECSYDITVIDETPPVATAKKNLVVSLTSSIGEGEANGGVAKVFAKDIDNGSYDNCSEVRLEIRRPEGSLSCGNDGEIVRGGAVYNNNITFNDLLDLDEYSDFDTDEGLFVKFCCDDVNDQEVDANGDGVIDEQDAGYHEVILRVWDDGNMNGIIGDEGDNYNDTWAYVKVEDKIVPKLYCEPVTEYCDEDIYYQRVPEWTIYNVDSSKIDPATVPSIESACNGYSLEYRDVANILTCHTGTITRTWRILDTRVSCDQIITILGRERTAVLDFPIALHSWAKCTLTEEEVIENAVLSTKAAQYGGNGDGGNLMKLDSNGRPVKFIGDYRNIGCEVFGRDIKINEYEVGDGCKKWLVVYDYINWCENDNAGTRTTIFKFEDKIPPLIIADAADTTAVDISCTAMFGIEAVGRDDNGCGVGYHWEITVSGIDYLQTKKAEGAVLTGTEAKFTNLTPGTYSIHYKLTDGCGNFTELTTILIVEGKAPTPYCVSLSSAVMKNGVVELWARDFDKNSSDNCLDDVLYFTFNEMYPVLNKWDKTHYFKGNGIEASEIEYNAGQAQKWVPEIRNGKVAGGTSGQLFGCKVGDGSSFPTSKVKMTVWDRDLRHDFCEVTLTLIDNNGACGGASRVIIDGVVQVESGTALPNTEVALDAALPEYPVKAKTDVRGTYAFGGVPVGVDYSVKPSIYGQYKNGVNTLDLVHIQRHILALKKLSSPYKMIAADVSGDQAIRVEDLVLLRKLILGVNEGLPNNLSWRFVNAAQSMGITPWPFTETASHASLMEAKSDRFIGVKLGDVDNSVSLNIWDTPTLPRHKGISFTTEDRMLNKGEETEIALRALHFSEVYGFQLSAALAGIDLLKIEGRGIEMDASNFNMVTKDLLAMSWSSGMAHSVADGSIVMTMKIRARVSGRLSDLMKINNDLMVSESYLGDQLEVGKVSLEVRNAQPSVFNLNQNEPNPWRGETSISYELPVAGKVKLTVLDIEGKVISVFNMDGKEGMNSLGMTKSDLGGVAGVLIYRIESGAFTAQKRMIVIH